MTLYKTIIVLLLGQIPCFIYAQGHIDNIKNQPYLKYAGQINCKDAIEDQLSARICANLTFQKSDSSLTIIYNELIKKSRGNNDTAQTKSIVQVQNNWRKLRDQHCSIVYDSFGKSGGNQQAISYLNCLTEMTNSRIKELEELYKTLNDQL